MKSKSVPSCSCGGLLDVHTTRRVSDCIRVQFAKCRSCGIPYKLIIQAICTINPIYRTKPLAHPTSVS